MCVWDSIVLWFDLTLYHHKTVCLDKEPELTTSFFKSHFCKCSHFVSTPIQQKYESTWYIPDPKPSNIHLILVHLTSKFQDFNSHQSTPNYLTGPFFNNILDTFQLIELFSNIINTRIQTKNTFQLQTFHVLLASLQATLVTMDALEVAKIWGRERQVN